MLTTKQIEILNAIKEGNSDGTLRTVYDLQEALYWKPERTALLHVLRTLEQESFIERKEVMASDSNRKLKAFIVTTKAMEYI